MSAGFVYLRPLSIVCVRALGPYESPRRKPGGSCSLGWRQRHAPRRRLRLRSDARQSAMTVQGSVPLRRLRRTDSQAMRAQCRTASASRGCQAAPMRACARRALAGLGDAIPSLRDGWVPSNGLAIDPHARSSRSTSMIRPRPRKSDASISAFRSAWTPQTLGGLRRPLFARHCSSTGRRAQVATSSANLRAREPRPCPASTRPVPSFPSASPC